MKSIKTAKKVKKKSQTKITRPLKSGDVPVTMRLLDLVKQELKSEITTFRLETKASFADVNTKLTKMMVLIEEQNARNKVVLDGYTQIYDKVEVLEKTFAERESE